MHPSDAHDRLRRRPGDQVDESTPPAARPRLAQTSCEFWYIQPIRTLWRPAGPTRPGPDVRRQALLHLSADAFHIIGSPLRTGVQRPDTVAAITPSPACRSGLTFSHGWTK
jgi:hypothetical protein